MSPATLEEGLSDYAIGARDRALRLDRASLFDEGRYEVRAQRLIAPRSAARPAGCRQRS